MKPVPLFSCGSAAILFFVLVVSASAASKTASINPDLGRETSEEKAKIYEKEYNVLHANTEDKDGLESIR